MFVCLQCEVVYVAVRGSLKSGRYTLQISKMLKRHYRTVKKAADEILWKKFKVPLQRKNR